MAKETYYFSHDYNARNDRKIAALVRDYKSSGYGIFWATCEMMHEEDGYLEFDDLTIDAIAKDMNESAEFVSQVLNDCISKYRLFTKQTKQNEAENFASMLLSSRIIRNLDGKNEKRAIKAEAGRLGGIKSGESRRNENSLKQNEAVLQSASSNEANKSKVKEIKDIYKEGKKNFNTKPTISDFNGLPEQYFGISIQNVRIQKQVDIDNKIVSSMWEIFKVQKLTGDDYYPNEGKVYSYFVDWIKFQNFNTGTKTVNGKKQVNI